MLLNTYLKWFLYSKIVPELLKQIQIEIVYIVIALYNIQKNHLEKKIFCKT